MIKQLFAAILMTLTPIALASPAAAQAPEQNTSKLQVQQLALPDQPDDTVYCRPPMELPGRRLLGPKVCKPQKAWDDLHKKGLDLGPDGTSVVESEKFRTIHCSAAGGC